MLPDKISKICLFLGGVMLAIIIAELAVRIFDIPPKPLSPLSIPSYRLSENPVIGYEYIPGYKPTDRPFDSSHEGYAINSAGFRDYEYNEKKPAKTYRVIVLGDSTTAGNTIPEIEKIYTKQLERLLNSDSNNAMHYEVLNMGVGGYHTMQEIELLRTRGLKYDPDLVLIAFCLNDLELHADGGVYRALYKQTHYFSQANTPRPLQSIFKFSRLAFIIYYHIYGIVNRDNYDDWYRKNVLDNKTTAEAGFILLSKLQQKYGFSAAVLILPDFNVHFDKHRNIKIYKSVYQAVENLSGITVIDLRKSFLDVNNDMSRFSHDGCHLNEYGHQIMAEILLPIVKNQRAISCKNNSGDRIE